MPTKAVAARNERLDKSKAYAKLKNQTDFHPTGLSNPDPWHVKGVHDSELGYSMHRNPDGRYFHISWSSSDEEKLRRHINDGAQVVSAKKAVEVYDIPVSQINKTLNRAERRGMILMEMPLEAYQAKRARMTLASWRKTDADIKKFEKMGLARDPQEMRKRNRTHQIEDPQGLQEKRTQTTTENVETQRERRRRTRLGNDAEREAMEQMQEMLESGRITEKELESGVELEEGQKVVRMEDPDKDSDFASVDELDPKDL